MPTDNIAVLEYPLLTLWLSISPIFRGNGVVLRSDNGAAISGTSAFGKLCSMYGDWD